MSNPKPPRLPRLTPHPPRPPAEPSELMPTTTGDLRLRDPWAPLLVELMADGRLRASLEEARERLRDRVARAELLRTGPGWALLRSAGPSPEGSTRLVAEQQHEVTLAGALGEASLSMIDVVGFLAGGQQTGILSVHIDDVERAVYLRRGDVVWASSTSPLDQIGPFLVRRGKITEGQLAMLAQTSPSTVGRTSVERGFIAAHELFALVREQLLEIFEGVLGAERGLWTFARASDEALAESQLNLPTQGLLLDAMRRLDEMRLYRQVIRSSSTLLRRLDPPTDRAPRVEGDAREAALALHANLPRSTSVRDVMHLTGRGEFEVTRILYVLHRAGLVEILREEAPYVSAPSPGLGRDAIQGMLSTYGLAVREVLDEIARTEPVAPLVQSLREFIGSPPRDHQKVLAAVRLLPSGLVDERGSLAGLEVLGVHRDELRHALSELVLFLMFEASARLQGRRREDLARRVKMIQAMTESAGD